jgi:hypothetical protein
MYKSVNISEGTYRQLQRIATQLNKPKAQVVELLVKGYDKMMEEREKEKLDKFNKEMGAKIKALKLSKKSKFDSERMDEDFAALARSDYLR